MGARDTLNTSMTVDEECLGVDATHSSATPAFPPANAEIPASTITTPPGDAIETTLDVSFGKTDTQTHSNTTRTLPSMPATDVTKISSQALGHCLGTKENRLRIPGEVDVQTLSSTSAVSSGITKATRSNITTPSGEEGETKLNTEFGWVGEVDVQTHASTLAVSPADAPGDEAETTLDAVFGEVNMQTHSNTTSALPPTSVAEITTSTTLPKDEGGPPLDVMRSGQTGEVDVRAPDSGTKTPEQKVPTTPN